jgi:parallel beta-helix repeat protein
LSRTIIVPDDYPTIRDAVDVADDGDTVFVKQGLYYESGITITRSISLLGQDRETTIIDGTREYAHILTVNADNVTIKGFTVTKGFYGCWVFGSGCQIINNNFIGNDEGISMDYGDGNTVSGNLFRGNDACGIATLGSSNNVLTANVIRETRYFGIYIYNGNNNTIFENEIADNLDVGIILDIYSSNNIVRKNDILRNGWGGELWNSGIVLWNFAKSNYIVSNNVSGNAKGVFQARTNDNRIYHNSFIGNGEQLVEWDSSSNVWDDGYSSGGNYWGDYAGVDQKRGPYQNLTGTDGIGDTPYTIEGNNIDHYPLMIPYVYVLGDLNNDDKVNMIDIGIAASAFGSFPDHLRWKPEADINQDGVIDLRDIAIVARNFLMPL